MGVLQVKWATGKSTPHFDLILVQFSSWSEGIFGLLVIPAARCYQEPGWPLCVRAEIEAAVP